MVLTVNVVIAEYTYVTYGFPRDISVTSAQNNQHKRDKVGWVHEIDLFTTWNELFTREN